jgi:hypothetical protein
MNIGKCGGALDNSCSTVARPINKFFDKARENPEKIEIHAFTIFFHFLFSDQLSRRITQARIS